MLNGDQVTAFREQGFLKLPGVVAPEEVAALRAVVDGLVAGLDDLPEDVRRDFHYGGLFGDDIGRGAHLCRLEYTFSKHRAFLELLGNPRVLEIAASLHAGPVVVTWEDMVIKWPGSGLGVPWHQDSDYQATNGVVFSVGIYLDDSPDDPLTVIPGTHRDGPLDEDVVDAIAAQRAAEAVELPVRAGDVIVHNVRVIHSSRPNDGRRLRRVVYFEFRTVDSVRHDSPWDDRWLDRRLPYVPLAIRLRGSGAGDDPALVADLRRRHPEWYEPVGADVDLRVHHDEIAERA